MPRFFLNSALLPAMLAAGEASAAAPAQPANAPAAIIFGSCPQRPVMPPAAREEKREGTVALAFVVDADSTVLDSMVMRSSGHADLDEAARLGLSKCKFRAATLDGQAVRGKAELNYTWKLN